MNIKNNQKSKNSIAKIQNALYNLLSTVGHKKLTIKLVCNEAQINRTTFYAHFDSIEDALYQMCEKHIIDVFKIFLKLDLPYKLRVKESLQIIKNNYSFFEYIFTNVNNLELRVIEMVENSDLYDKSNSNYKNTKLSLAFIISGFVGIGKTYFNDLKSNKTAKISIDDFANLIFNVINQNNPYFTIK